MEEIPPRREPNDLVLVQRVTRGSIPNRTPELYGLHSLYIAPRAGGGAIAPNPAHQSAGAKSPKPNLG
jgi:hypothetical protein